MSFDFTNNRVVFNPAKRFFGNYIIQGDNVELPPIKYSSHNPESQKISKFIEGVKSDEALKQLLKEMEISHIIYTDDIESIDNINYKFLEDSSLLKKILQEEKLHLYELTAP